MRDSGNAGGSAIYLNDQIVHTVNAPKFTLNNATLTAAGGAGMYMAGHGETVINGGSVTGDSTAIELRAGTLKLNGGTYTANAESYSYEANGNGATTEGAAIAVMQHTTKKDLSVEINGGEFNGAMTLAETNVQKNDPDPHVELRITNGTFNGGVTVDDCDNFIADGKFTTDVTKYCISGKMAKQGEDGLYSIVDIPTVDDDARSRTRSASSSRTCLPPAMVSLRAIRLRRQKLRGTCRLRWATRQKP